MNTELLSHIIDSSCILRYGDLTVLLLTNDKFHLFKLSYCVHLAVIFFINFLSSKHLNPPWQCFNQTLNCRTINCVLSESYKIVCLYWLCRFCYVESYFEPCCCLVRLLYNFGWLNNVILHACLWFTPANPNPALYLSSPFLYSFLATQKHGIIVCKLLTNLWLVYLNASLVPRLFMICLKWVAWVSENDLNGTWNLKPDCREWCSNSHIYVL